jgi:hypothetical protein
VRYYSLTLVNQSTGKVWVPTATGDGFAQGGTGPTFSSLSPNGRTNPGALQIEFDIPVYSYDAFEGNAMITVHGVGLKMLSQSADLNGATFTLAGGMQPGLPLATAAFQDKQSGILLQGTVFQAFGNWQGTDQSLHLVCNPGAANQNDQNINFNWAAGTPLANAINQALTAAFSPGYKIDTSAVTPNLVLSNAEHGHYTSLANFASVVKDLSLKIGNSLFGPNSNYPGVLITIQGNTIVAQDGSKPPAAKAIKFQDLVGQPTWISAATVNFKTVLRADLAVGSRITFPTVVQPPFALTTTAAAVPNAPSSSKSAFQGTFTIQNLHHFASFRQPDGDSWATSIDAVTSFAPPT